MKTCSKCKIEKPKDSFHKGKTTRMCKDCKKAYDVEYRVTWNKKPYSRISRYKSHLKNRYSVTLEEIVLRYESQGGGCSICNKALPHPADENGDRWQTNIDHDHNCCPTDTTCGSCTRGLLCRDCNLMLGHAKDNLETLKKAVEYLERTSTKVGN
jgi:hypothetical protein